jgi:predicted amidophosphoribosyltransferase
MSNHNNYFCEFCGNPLPSTLPQCSKCNSPNPHYISKVLKPHRTIVNREQMELLNLQEQREMDKFNKKATDLGLFIVFCLLVCLTFYLIKW